jgi:hypothetical protein
MTVGDKFPLYREVIAPQVTPLGAVSAVVDGAADVAPVDSYALSLLQKYRRDLTSQLRTIAHTPRTPIPPLVASTAGLSKLQAAFLEADRIPGVAPLMAELLLQRFERPDPNAYDALRLRFETATGYWRQHTLAALIHPAFAAVPAPFAS